MFYAGIGSRETPQEILDWFIVVAKYLAKNGYILRSGGANGADEYFEKGCDLVNGSKEIFIPWHGDSNLVVNKQKTSEVAKEFHPYWNNLSQGAQKLQARNTHQVLGWDLSTPSSFIICYTKNGEGKGGTGQAIRIAKHNNIPIFDAGLYEDIKEVKQKFKSFIKDNTSLLKESD